jgi:putative DNA methylase
VANVGFSIVNAHPVKGEMSVAAPKAQAKEPIQLDVILVCRKRSLDRRPETTAAIALERAFEKAVAKATRLRDAGLKLSRNDRRVILTSQLLAELGPVRSARGLANALIENEPNIEAALDDPRFEAAHVALALSSDGSVGNLVQGSLFE